MTPLSHTRASVRLVQDRLRGWLEARLVEAEAGKEPRVGLHALRVSPPRVCAPTELTITRPC